MGLIYIRTSDPGNRPDAVPLRKIPLNKVPFVPNNESLLHTLDRDRFQEGRSHMVIISRFSVEKATSVRKVAKHALAQRRLRQSVGIGDSADSSESSDDEKSHSGPRTSAEDCKERSKGVSWVDDSETEATIQGDATTELNDTQKEVQGPPITVKNGVRPKRRRHRRTTDLEAGPVDETETGSKTKDKPKIRLQNPGLAWNKPCPLTLF